MGPLLGEATYTVSQLADEIREFLSEAFPPLWVVGEVQRLRPSRAGHVYFELVEKGRGDQIVGKLDAVIWRTDHQRIQRRLAAAQQRLSEGQQVRCLARVDFYPPGGRLQLVVRDVDPLFTLGHLEQRRQQVLAFLAQQGLMETNRQRPLAAIPLNIGLVTSEESAAYHDFVSGLQASPYGFRLAFVHAAMQGRETERQVPSALSLLAASARRLDAIVLIRGGGAKSDLAAFDSQVIAEAVARCPLPVLTGLGHEIDQSITDQVSHQAFKTPTMVAEFLSDRVRQAEQRLHDTATAIGHRAHQTLQRAGLEVQRSERLAQAAQFRLASVSGALADVERALASLGRRRLEEAARWLDDRQQRLVAQSQRSIERRRPEAEQLARRLVELASGRIAVGHAAIEGMARLCHEVSPQRVLERGFSMTRDGAGKILRRSQDAQPGDQLSTRLAEGEVKSRVEEK